MLRVATALLLANSFCAPRRIVALRRPNTAVAAVSNEELLNAISSLSDRIDAIAADVETLKQSRVEGLEAELNTLRATSTAEALMSTAEALRTPPAASAARTAPSFQGAMAARAALGAISGKQPATSNALKREATVYDAEEVEELGGEAFFFEGASSGKNDAFLDDTLEELLAIGGDPSFLEQARGEGEGEFTWDGVEDDSVHFDDPVD